MKLMIFNLPAEVDEQQVHLLLGNSRGGLPLPDGATGGCEVVLQAGGSGERFAVVQVAMSAVHAGWMARRIDGRRLGDQTLRCWTAHMDWR